MAQISFHVVFFFFYSDSYFCNFELIIFTLLYYVSDRGQLLRVLGEGAQLSGISPYLYTLRH